jgi:hypothetical protein
MVAGVRMTTIFIHILLHFSSVSIKLFDAEKLDEEFNFAFVNQGAPLAETDHLSIA